MGNITRKFTLQTIIGEQVRVICETVDGSSVMLSISVTNGPYLSEGRVGVAVALRKTEMERLYHALGEALTDV